MLLRLIVSFSACLLFIAACKKKPTDPSDSSPIVDTAYGGFPDEVGKIFHAKCVDGCHDAANRRSELRMDTWDNLFYGGAHGASVVPYSTDYSLLLHYININPANGPVATPGMPYEQPPLSNEEYKTIKEWIAKGAPDRNGKIAFSDYADTRQKIYVIQGCDQVAVIDAERKVVMRYIPIGNSPNPEGPHCLRVSDDGKFAYVSFKSASFFQKIDTKTDSVVEQIALGIPSWEILLPSPDGKTIMLSNMSGKKVRKVDMVSKQQIDYGREEPHGIAAMPGFEMFFVTTQTGNQIGKLSTTDIMYNKTFTLDGKPARQGEGSYDPHEVVLSPDQDKLFITCQTLDSLAVMDTSGAILKMLPTGRKPQEMAISKKHNYLFVSCMEQPWSKSTAQVEFKGAVDVFNYKTLQWVTRIEGPFVEVHSVAVDERSDRLYIFSLNSGVKGPLPHHFFGCGDRNGYFHVYDIGNLNVPLQGKRELLPNPYSADVRFK